MWQAMLWRLRASNLARFESFLYQQWAWSRDGGKVGVAMSEIVVTNCRGADPLQGFNSELEITKERFYQYRYTCLLLSMLSYMLLSATVLL
jgi:hypothetical protein